MSGTQAASAATKVTDYSGLQTDRYLGKVESLGLREDTIIVFQSDHGHSQEERTFGGAGSAAKDTEATVPTGPDSSEELNPTAM